MPAKGDRHVVSCGIFHHLKIACIPLSLTLSRSSTIQMIKPATIVCQASVYLFFLPPFSRVQRGSKKGLKNQWHNEISMLKLSWGANSKSISNEIVNIARKSSKNSIIFLNLQYFPSERPLLEGQCLIFQENCVTDASTFGCD